MDEKELTSKTIQNNQAAILDLVRKLLDSDIDRHDFCAELYRIRDIEKLYLNNEGGLK
jgi:hypothetical protein